MTLRRPCPQSPLSWTVLSLIALAVLATAQDAPIRAGDGFVEPDHPAAVSSDTSRTAPSRCFLHLPTADKTPTALREITVHLGRGEFEYLEVNCSTDVAREAVPVRLRMPDKFSGKADLLVEQDFHLLPGAAVTLKPGERNPLWIVFSTHGVEAGTYAFRLTVAPPDAPLMELSITLVVLPLDCPHLDDVYVSGFWSSFCGIFGEGKLYPDVRDPERMLRLWEACVEDMRHWGQNMLEVRFTAFGKDDVIRRYIHVARFEKGYLPVLDLSGWDPILEIAQKQGMRHVVFRYVYTAPSWLPPQYDQLTPEQKQEVDFFILRQLIAHLKERGFERIFWYLIDEIKPYADVVDPVIEKMEAHHRAFPELEFAGSGFAHVPLRERVGQDGKPWRGMENMAPYLSWIAPYRNVHSVYKWIHSGEMSIPPRAIIATQASADHKRPYVENRRFLWSLWLEGGTGYQIYGYHTHFPEHKYSPVFPGPERPIYSPVYASLVDGHEDFQYLHLCRHTLKDLRAKGQTERAQAFEKALGDIVGREDSLLPLRFNPPVAYDPGRSPIPYLLCDEAALRLAHRKIMELLIEYQKN